MWGGSAGDYVYLARGRDVVHLGTEQDYGTVIPDGFVDRFYCGPARDSIELLNRRDPHDTFTGCEIIRVNNPT